MSAGQKCRTENYATCKEKAVCSGGQAICPTSLPMPDGTQKYYIFDRQHYFCGPKGREIKLNQRIKSIVELAVMNLFFYH